MEPEVIYRKTARGLEAIAKRLHGLGPRERSLLIMVDGRRTLSELAALGEAGEILPLLLREGLIEPVVQRTSPVPAPSPAPAAESAPLSLGAAQRLAVRRLTDLLGPHAADVCMRIEKTRTAQEFLAVLRQAEALLAQARGAAAASRFAREAGNVRTG